MKIYLAIKFHADQRNRAAIEALSALWSDQGHTVVCVTRDLERWGAVTLALDELMRHSFRAIDQADLVVVDLTEKGVGLGIEAGYAHARAIPVLTIAQAGSDISATLRGISAAVYLYANYSELTHLPLPAITPHRDALTTWGYAERSIDRLLHTLEGLEPTALNWRPLPTASTLAILATHILGNIEETVLGLLCGQTLQRNRAAEFQVQAIATAELQARWHTLRSAITAGLAQLTPADLDQRRTHPRRGSLTGWEILLIVARHAAEHLAHAELTRDLWLATMQGDIQSVQTER
ncbi:MAG: DinB family protein [Caldilineaceae bacterium]